MTELKYEIVPYKKMKGIDSEKNIIYLQTWSVARYWDAHPGYQFRTIVGFTQGGRPMWLTNFGKILDFEETPKEMFEKLKKDNFPVVRDDDMKMEYIYFDVAGR